MQGRICSRIAGSGERHGKLNEKITANSAIKINQKLFVGLYLTQAEGFILGVGAKIFTIAGPVIVYGLAASVVYGLIYWIYTLF